MTKYATFMKRLRTLEPEVAKEIHRQVCAKKMSFDSNSKTIPQMINSARVITVGQAINYGPEWYTLPRGQLKMKFQELGLSDLRLEMF